MIISRQELIDKLVEQKNKEMLQERLAMIFGWSINRVMSTPLEQMLLKLVCVVSDYEKLIKEQNKTIEEHRETLARIDAYMLVLRGLSK